MWIEEPEIVEKICGSLEDLSQLSESVIRCPKCGKNIYKEDDEDRCPFCLTLLKGKSELIFRSGHPFGIISALFFSLVLITDYMPVILVVLLSTRIITYAFGIFSLFYMVFAIRWTLWVNPLYLRYVQINDDEFQVRDIEASRLRCNIYFLFWACLFVLLAIIIPIEPKFVFITIASLLAAYLITSANITFPQIIKYEPFFFTYVMRATHWDHRAFMVAVYFFGALPIGLIAFIVRKLLMPGGL